mmetsp:Transcript_11829/g.10572  ORF Transcript_11829/g.10572 Transcript_11829/m.10572 type:complete len:187 (-) Transcript_11829:186-746(-)
MYGLLLALYTLLLVVRGADDEIWGYYDDIYADAHHYCCRMYTSRNACRKSANYNCMWLNKKDMTDRAIIRRFGNQCVGQGFGICKRDDISQRCFSGTGNLTPPTCNLEDWETDVCVYQDEDDEMILSHAVNVGQSESTMNLEYVAIGGLVLLAIGGCLYYKKRVNGKVDSDASSLINNGYGTTGFP